MSDPVSRYLSEIGRRGGVRSRRALTAEQARALATIRDAKRAVREFEHSPLGAPDSELPGVEIVRAGLRDLARRERTSDAMLVSIASPRLRQIGIRVPEVIPQPEEALFDHLEGLHGAGAHSRYNALIRRIVSFARAAAVATRAHT